MVASRLLLPLVAFVVVHAMEQSNGFDDSSLSLDKQKREIAVDNFAHAAEFSGANKKRRLVRAQPDEDSSGKDAIDAVGDISASTHLSDKRSQAEDDAHILAELDLQDYKTPDDSDEELAGIEDDVLLEGEEAEMLENVAVSSSLMGKSPRRRRRRAWWDRRRRRRRFDCKMNGWSGYGGCSANCNTGSMCKTRSSNGGPLHGGKACSDTGTSWCTQCNTHSCPVNCYISEYSAWTACTKTCASGTQAATRSKVGPFHGGAACANDALSKSQQCNTHACPVDCYFQDWSAWGSCSKTCIDNGNYGYKNRNRGRVGPYHGGAACVGHVSDDAMCNEFTCPMDCEVGEWGAWSVCSQSCSVSTETHGFKTRSRTSVAASNGGKACGENWQMDHCNKILCPMACYWMDWGIWGPCSRTCSRPNEAAGNMLRVRDKIGPSMGGPECTGENVQSQACSDANCPVDCVWAEWSAFENCSTTCGTGGSVRKRQKQPATHGGAECVGASLHVESCNIFECPVDCAWTEWNSWNPCSKTCGGGNTHRDRSYDPKPQNGGSHCVGAHVEMIECGSESCPTDCRWEEWLEWGLCSASCGSEGNMHTRMRLVAIQAGNGGNPCSGSASEHINCTTSQPCPVDCSLGDWQEWSTCNASCGSGMQTAKRVLRQAAHGGSEVCPAEEEYELEKVMDCEDTNGTNGTGCDAVDTSPEIKAGAQSSMELGLFSSLCVAALILQHF